MNGINQPQSFQIPARVGDRVIWNTNQMATVVEVYNDSHVLIRTDLEHALVRVPAYQLTLTMKAEKPKKRRHIVPVAIVIVAAFVALVGLVNGLTGEGTPDAATPTVTAQKAPAPKAEPAPAPKAAPTVEDLEAALPECDVPWVAGEDAGFDGSQYGVELEACGSFDGDPTAVVDMSGSDITPDALNSVLKEQGTFAGSFSLVGDTFLIITPEKRDVQGAQDTLGGIVDEL